MRPLQLKKINRIQFGILSPEEIRRMAVARILTADTYAEDGSPIESGLMDRRLGTIEPGQRCRTCGNQVGDCPGHFGIIELARPVIMVGFAKIVHRLLRCTCRSCSRTLLTEDESQDYLLQIKAVMDKGSNIPQEIVKTVVKDARKKTKCPWCETEQFKIKFDKPTTFSEETDVGLVRLTPTEIQGRFENTLADDLLILGVNAEYARPEWMILNVLPVPPVAVRASITLESGVRSEDDLTHKLVDIIRINQRLRENIEAGAPQLIVEDLWELLQYHVTTYMDNEVAGIPPARHRSGRALRTLTQRLRGKEGRFRGNLSGKRVDFSARTVISPDPYISINEVGVPEQIAKILTIPETVTEWNIEEMKELVMSGPIGHPGSNYIIRPDTKRVDLRYVADLKETAETIENGFVVERHLRDGDIVLFNRQPSLHRMSIMAHEVRVMPHRTFRLNLCVCIAGKSEVLTDQGKVAISELVKDYEKYAPLSCSWNNGRHVYFSGVKRPFVVNPQELGLKSYRISTKNGRTIEATAEHPFYAKQGITKAGNLRVGDFVAVYPIDFPKVDGSGLIILTQEQIKAAMPDEAYEEYTLRELEEMGLLAIPGGSRTQIDLASLVGHLLGDGSLLISYEGGRAIFRAADKTDIDRLYQMVESLGMKPTAIKEFESRGTSPITTVTGKVYHAKGKSYFFEVRRKPVAIAFKALGVPVGDRVTQSYRVPEWIRTGSKMIKRAFLRSYFGAEMSTPRVEPRSPKRFRQPIFKMAKIEGIDPNPLIDDIRKLLEEFGVEIATLSTEKGNIRKKDGKVTIIYVSTLSASDENLLTFFRKIGFEFAKEKEVFARLASEYITCKQKAKNEATKQLKKAVELRNQGLSYEKIAHEIGHPSWSTVASWINNKRKEAGLPSDFPDFPDWRVQGTENLNNGFIWDEIASIDEIELPVVYDITTTDTNHNFVAEGFLTRNCTPYNADFDGDEMNLHVPQSEEARAETRVLMRVQEQILSPRYGGPIIGAIHDYVSAAFLLTQKKTLINKEGAWQLLLAGNYEGELPRPAIVYPEEKWAGKQIFGLLLPTEVNMTAKTRTCRKHDTCMRESCAHDCYMVVKNGLLLSGTIDRRAIGADESESLLHVVVKDHGSDVARDFIDSLTQMLLTYLSHLGFSLGYSNVLIPQEGKNRIKKILEDAEAETERMIQVYRRGELDPLPGKSSRETLEMRIMQVLSKARDDSGEIAGKYMGISNTAVVMAVTGARGNQLNIAQMSASVGQQSIRGERILRGYYRRALPHFKKDDIGAFARGFVRSNYRDGLSPIEFFFHAQGGREGLVDTAVRTSTSGYLQRRLVNALQDLRVSYDSAVRTSEEEIVQLIYGEDSVDPAKSYHGRPVDVAAIIDEVLSQTRTRL